LNRASTLERYISLEEIAIVITEFMKELIVSTELGSGDKRPGGVQRGTAWVPPLANFLGFGDFWQDMVSE
jgi:hypothetical protein